MFMCSKKCCCNTNVFTDFLKTMCSSEEMFICSEIESETKSRKKEKIK